MERLLIPMRYAALRFLPFARSTAAGRVAASELGIVLLDGVDWRLRVPGDELSEGSV